MTGSDSSKRVRRHCAIQPPSLTTASVLADVRRATGARMTIRAQAKRTPSSPYEDYDYSCQVMSIVPGTTKLNCFFDLELDLSTGMYSHYEERLMVDVAEFSESITWPQDQYPGGSNCCPLGTPLRSGVHCSACLQEARQEARSAFKGLNVKKMSTQEAERRRTAIEKQHLDKLPILGYGICFECPKHGAFADGSDFSDGLAPLREHAPSYIDIDEEGNPCGSSASDSGQSDVDFETDDSMFSDTSTDLEEEGQGVAAASKPQRGRVAAADGGGKAKRPSDALKSAIRAFKRVVHEVPAAPPSPDSELGRHLKAQKALCATLFGVECPDGALDVLNSIDVDSFATM